MMKRSKTWCSHGLLPPDAQRKLQEAAATPNTERDPLARLKAIEDAQRWIRKTYPNVLKEN